VTNPFMHISHSARPGLAVLMASAVVVLKHETSNLRQSHNFIPSDLKLIKKTYHLIKAVNGVSRSHKTSNIFFSFDSVA